MPVTVGDAVVRFIGDRSKLNSDFKAAEKDTRGFAKRAAGGVKSALGGVFKVAGGMLAAQAVSRVGGAVVGMFKGAIDYGADATEMLSKFEVTFGKAGESLTQDLDDFAERGGRSRYMLRGMAADLGAVLKGMSLSEDMAAQYSGRFTELAVDVGSFMNAQAPDVMDKFRAAMTGEYESLKSLGIVINQASVEQELLNMGIEGGAKAATEAQLVQARYNLLIQKTVDAQGDAERTADSWSNTQVRLSGIWQDFMTDVGMGTTKALSPALSTVADLASKALPKLASILTGKVLPGIGDLVERGANAAKSIGELAGRFREWRQNLDLGGKFEGFLEGLGGFGELFSGIWGDLKEGDIGGALSRLINIPGMLAQLKLDLLQGLFTLGGDILDNIGEAFPSLQPAIDNWLGPLFDLGASGVETFGDIKGQLIGGIKGALGQIVAGDFAGAGETLGSTLRDVYGTAADWVSTNVGPLAEKAFQALRAMLTTAGTRLSESDNPLARIIGDIINGALGVSAGGATGGGDVGAGAAAASPLGERVFAMIKGAFTGLAQRVPELAGILKAQISGILSKALGGGGTGGGDVGAGAAMAGANPIGERIKGMLSSAFDTLTSAPPAAAEKVSAWIRGVISDATSKVAEGGQVEDGAKGIFDALYAMQDKAVALLDENGADVAGRYAEAMGRILRVGIQTLGTMVGSLATLVWEAVKGIVSSAGDQAGEASGDDSNGMFKILMGMWQAALSGFLEGLFGSGWADQLVAEVVAGAEKAVEGIEETADQWVSAGEDLVEGLIEGVKNKAKSLATAAIDAVKGGLQSAKDFLRIGSPSKLAADEVGAPVPLGIAKGIMATQGAPVDAMVTMLGGLRQAADAMMEGITESQAKKLEKMGEWVLGIARGFEVMSGLGGKTIDPEAIRQRFAKLQEVLVFAIDHFQHLENLFGYSKIKSLEKTVKRFRRMLEVVVFDLSAIKDFQVPDVQGWAATIEDAIRRVLSMVLGIEQEYGEGNLKMGAKLAEMILGLLQLLGVSFENIRASDAVDYQVVVDTFVTQLKASITALVNGLLALPAEVKIGAAAAAELATTLGPVLGLLGTSFKQLVETVGLEWPDLTVWKARFSGAVTLLLDALTEFLPRLDELKEKAALVTPLQSILGLLRTNLKVELPDADTYAAAIASFATLLVLAATTLATELGTLDAEWAAADMFAAKVVGNVQSVLGLLLTTLNIELPDAWGWRDAIVTFARALVYAGQTLAAELEALAPKWADAEMFAAQVVSNLQTVLSLLGTALTVNLPKSETWRHDLSMFAVLIRWAGQQIQASLAYLGEEWGSTEMFAAKAAANLQTVLGLLATALQVSLPKSDTWRHDLSTFAMLVRWAGQQIKSELDKLADEWGQAEMFATKAAQNLQAILGLLGVNLAVSLPSTDFKTVLAQFIKDLIEGAKQLAKAMPDLAAEFVTARNGVETDALPQAVETSSKLQELFGILDIATAFRDLSIQPKLQHGQYRTAVSNVISGLITELKNSIPILETGLTEVQELWSSTLDSFMGEDGLLAKIEEVFTRIANAIKAAASIGDTTLSVGGILINLQKLYDALLGAGQYTVPELPSLPSNNPTEGRVPLIDYQELGAAVAAAIAGNPEDRAVLEVRLGDGLRAEFSRQFDRLEAEIRTLSGALAAAGV